MDLDSLFKRAFDGFGSNPEPAGFPGVPGSDEITGNGQTIVDICISRCSRFSRSENEVLGSGQKSTPKNADDYLADDRAREDPFKTPGKPGTPGNEGKTLAESTSLQFPVKDRQPGTPGTGSDFCGSPLSDQSRAAPPPDDPLPITAADVQAGVARELRALAEDGRSGPDALRDAVAIVRAKIRNAPALAEWQPNDGRCHACGEPLDGSRAEVAVLNPGGRALHLHGGACHDTHSRRRAALVDRIMSAAGYGAEQSTGKAA